MNMLINFFSHLNGKSVKDSDIKWNFEKFLIDRKGNVVRRFSPTVKPEQLEVYIQQLLKD